MRRNLQKLRVCQPKVIPIHRRFLSEFLNDKAAIMPTMFMGLDPKTQWQHDLDNLPATCVSRRKIRQGLLVGPPNFHAEELFIGIIGIKSIPERGVTAGASAQGFTITHRVQIQNSKLSHSDHDIRSLDNRLNCVADFQI